MNSGAISNYPPGVDVNHPHFDEAPGPVSECGECHAVCYARNLQACGCGCQVLACSKCTVAVDGQEWRSSCAQIHARELAQLVRLELAECYGDLAHDLREALKLGKKFQQADSLSGAVVDALRHLDEAADLLAKRASELVKDGEK